MKKFLLLLAVCLFAALFSGCQVEKGIQPNVSEVRNLQADTPVGTGTYLNYVDEKFLVFQAEFGLFGFDLEKNEVRFSFDLQKAIGTTNFQGTEDVAVVHVSSDGTQIEVYSSADPDTAYYIQTSDGSYEKTKRQKFEYVFGAGPDNPNWGDLFSENDVGAVGTVTDVQFTRGGKTWRIFENYDFS